MNVENEADFIRRLEETFRVEADEHLRGAAGGLIALEEGPSGPRRKQVLETVYRGWHSLKGAARAVGRTDIEEVCQSLEGLFALIRKADRDIPRRVFDVVQRATAVLSSWLEKKTAETGEQRQKLLSDLSGVEDEIGSDAGRETKPEDVERSVPAKEPVQRRRSELETVRVRTDKLDRFTRQFEEIRALESGADRLAQVSAVLSKLGEDWREQLLRFEPHARVLREALKQNLGQARLTVSSSSLERALSFVEWSRLHQHDTAGITKAHTAESNAYRQLARELVGRSLEGLRDIVTIPSSMILERIPPLVRDLAGSRRKEVKVTVEGGDVELDKRILDGIADPLIHIVRNCIDHGIETPGQRKLLKKPAAGKIDIRVVPAESGKVDIIVSDDGRGIDIKKVKKAAVRLDVADEKTVRGMSRPEVIDLVFLTDLSTSRTVTDISGRGLGMAIVKDKLEGISGKVSIESRDGAGTTVRMRVPSLYATFRGLMVLAARSRFLLPLRGVVRVIRLPRSETGSVEGHDVVSFQGRSLAMADLTELLGLVAAAEAEEDAADFKIIIVEHGGRSIALRVDEILDEQEIVARPLGGALSGNEFYVGGAILNDGAVVPILNPASLINLAGPRKKEISHSKMTPPPVRKPRDRSILVVEDSITARMLLKNILEAAGFRVATAADGVDALTSLKTGEFHLVVSDVDMPRMNGLVLTENIRKDPHLKNLPVVLVTALESKDDRERGVAAGADAYIVKSRFDQGDLLKTIERLAPE